MTPCRPEYAGSELALFEAATNWKRYLGRQIRPFLGKRVLEVGAGLAGTTPHLCDGSQDEWVCLEPDPALSSEIQLKIADGRLPACCRCVRGVVREQPRGANYQTILYIDVLEHIADDRVELEDASRLLSRDGYLVVLAPAHPCLFSDFDAAIGHFRRYSRASLSAIRPNGTATAMMAYLDSAGLVASFANRAALKRSMPTAGQLAFWDQRLVPFSMRLDPLLGYRLGKSILGVWKK